MAIGGSGYFALIASWAWFAPVVSAAMWTASILYGGYIGWLNADGSGVVVEYGYLNGSTKPLYTTVYDR